MHPYSPTSEREKERLCSRLEHLSLRDSEGAPNKVRKLITILALIFAATACFAGVNVSSPSNGATVGTSVHFVASANGSTTISAMIVYIDGSEAYRVYSNNLDTYINVGAGTHNALVRAWDNWGGIYDQGVGFTASA